jgi:hypothetical protein
MNGFADGHATYQISLPAEHRDGKNRFIGNLGKVFSL